MPIASSFPAQIAGRYTRIAQLGRGGMGEVWRVRDEVLGRDVAMKVVRDDIADLAVRERFREEAQVVAQLQHPGIVPLHDLGRLDDGRLWFTMREVVGRTLDEVTRGVHHAWRLGRDAHEGVSRHRLIELFLRACEAVAYAHDRGVVHRDLKPGNILVGEYGEVLVVDWGLAKVLGNPSDDRAILVRRAAAFHTGAGAIAGTPLFTSPEQARGGAATVGPQADVYSLGAILYQVLCDRPPRLERDVDSLLRRIAEGGPVRAPSQACPELGIDEGLDAICLRALSASAEARYRDAGGLAADLAAWLDGARRRERALLLVREADDFLAESARQAAEAERLETEAAAALAALAPTEPVSRKEEAWAKQDLARQCRADAELARGRSVQVLRGALTHAPDLAEAHERLADAFQRQHVRLEREGRHDEARGVEAELRAHDRPGRWTPWLRGIGALTLVTDPEGAEARLFRVSARSRRLEPVFERALGPTPLRAVPLERGNYLVEIEAPGRPVVRYPIAIGRQEHWDGVRPGDSAPHPIPIPTRAQLGPAGCYVPAGWGWYGDELFEVTPPLQRVWVEGFAIDRFPVTLGTWCGWLDTLIAEGRQAEVEAVVPRIPDSDEPFLERVGDRFIGIRSDQQGEHWAWLDRTPDVPIVCVSWPQVTAYARDQAARQQRPLRLPTEVEWEKAARGTDPRKYPWGEHFEAAWCRSKQTWPPKFVAVDTHPEDVSPYGVRGLAGNVQDWVADLPSPDRRMAKGGNHGYGPSTCVTTVRLIQSSVYRSPAVGFRLAVSIS
jgi:serine/threonine-protein kinase